ncbi:hypothetical protein J3R82DRAFT_8880 [Butyriboletus roseoflavus]|nr:hypothetical protein J3R82DRAFT_8880 [Butyriboletus roseoflavus]
MAGTQINTLLDICAMSSIKADGQTIDHIELGDVKWENFTVYYSCNCQANSAPPWMDDAYEVYFCSPHEVVWYILNNPDFSSETDYHPYHEFDSGTDEHQWCNFISGNWAWNQADPAMHGLVFVPVIPGSDKTTVSVATGQNDFYLLYLSIGNVRNNV